MFIYYNFFQENKWEFIAYDEERVYKMEGEHQIVRYGNGNLGLMHYDGEEIADKSLISFFDQDHFIFKDTNSIEFNNEEGVSGNFLFIRK